MLAPLVSVIIPTYNRSSLLPRAINSVLQQLLSAKEILVIDDGSTDNSHQVIQELTQQSPIPIRYFNTGSQKGVSAARNLGIAEANYPWLAFLDSDDQWLPHRLKDQFALLGNHPLLRVVHGEEIWIRRGVRVNPMKKHRKSGGHIFAACLPLCVISPSAVLIHKDVFNQVGTFNERFIVCEDYELWLRITSRMEVGYVEAPILIKYGGHSDQLSRQFIAMDYWRVIAIQETLLNRPALAPHLTELALETLIAKAQILLNGYDKHNNLENYEEINTILNWALVSRGQATTENDLL